MSEPQCPICHSCELTLLEQNTQEQICRVRCDICSQYKIQPHLISQKATFDQSYILSAVVRESFELRNTEVYIDHQTAKNLVEGREPKRLQDKILKLLQYIERKTEYYGFHVKLDFKNEYPVAFCKNVDEFVYLRNLLYDRGLIANITQDGFCNITAEGFEYLENFQGNIQESKKAFVAMCFNAELIDIYKNAIDPAIRSCGYDPIRIDYLEHTQKIDDVIINQINESRFVIADFTDHRPSVYFEAGYALGLGKQVIWLCREDQIEKCHFDTRQYNHIKWNSNEDLVTRLEQRILAVVGKGSWD